MSRCKHSAEEAWQLISEQLDQAPRRRRSRNLTINRKLKAEALESLGFIKLLADALTAAQRAGRWDMIKTLTGPEAGD